MGAQFRGKAELHVTHKPTPPRRAQDSRGVLLVYPKTILGGVTKKETLFRPWLFMAPRSLRRPPVATHVRSLGVCASPEP